MSADALVQRMYEEAMASERSGAYKEALIYGMTQGGLEAEMDLGDLFGLWVD